MQAKSHPDYPEILEEEFGESGLAQDIERNMFFLDMARNSGKENRMDYSWCYQGYACKVMPDKNNPYKWHIEFDNDNLDNGRGDATEPS